MGYLTPMQEQHFKDASEWAKNKHIQLSEGKKPGRTYAIDDIDIGLIRTGIFCVEDVWLRY